MNAAIVLALLAQDTPPLTVPDPSKDDLDLEQRCIEEYGEDDQAALTECLGIVDPLHSPLDEVEAQLAQQHPVQMYMFAGRIFGIEQRQDYALFWFYAGQLRWRTQLTCNPPEPGGEGALFGAMQATIGEEINPYAAQDADNWIATIGRVLEWDAANPDPLLPDGCDAALTQQREGLTELVDLIRERSESGEL